MSNATITITKSPFEEDYRPAGYGPPWEYSENAFIDWVHEVFMEGYKRNVELPSLDQALDIVRNGFGYSLKVVKYGD